MAARTNQGAVTCSVTQMSLFDGNSALRADRNSRVVNVGQLLPANVSEDSKSTLLK
jgi:hypothetical protein